MAAPYPFIENSHSHKAIRRFADKAGFCLFPSASFPHISAGADMMSPQWMAHAFSVYSS
ncbi:hypothetical protein [Bacteroides xylanisolvens]|uniref:hypothetical protein n=1 Tax=Bacteroides xylanisolvens TaxID=371601 RepID=UPI0022E7281D|nr:hypothetical protein [Bacteroides xylanisolvens]